MLLVNVENLKKIIFMLENWGVISIEMNLVSSIVGIILEKLKIKLENN